jgi:hypothetical protein
MLLWAVKPQVLMRSEAVHLPGDVSFETSDGFLLGQAFVGAALDVLGGARVVDHAGDHDVPKGGVGLTVAAAIEPVSFLLPAAGVDR